MRRSNRVLIALCYIMLTALTAGCGMNAGTPAAGAATKDAAPAPKETPVPEKAKDPVPVEAPEEAADVAEEQEPEEEEEEKPHIRLTVDDPGWDVFVPATGDHPDYRYGPALIRNDDGSIDAWFSAPGDGSREYDFITYKHSDDGGVTWGEERVVLRATSGAPDALSACDPDVFYYDGWYYLGYTSTINKKEKGLCNSAYLARSKQPEGPYEKWNGHGFGGAAVPIVYYDGVDIGWGAGEVSFVVKDDTLFVYSTKDSYSADPRRYRKTEVRTVSLKEENWPGKLTLRGYGLDRSDTVESEIDPDAEDPYIYKDADSWDVAYVEEADKFLALGCNRRFKIDSSLVYFESDDGICFRRVGELNNNVICKCHNCGLMTDEQGHIKPGDPILIAYAYSGAYRSAWGIWGTRMAPATLSLTEEFDRSEDGTENLKEALQCRPGVGNAAPVRCDANEAFDPGAEGDGPAGELVDFYPMTEKIEIPMGQPWIIKVRPMAIIRGQRLHELSGPELMKYGITFRCEDESICHAREDGNLFPKAEGETTVLVRSENGRQMTIAVRILPKMCN